MVPQAPEPLGQLRVLRRDRAAVTARHVLGRVEREDDRVAELSGADAVALHLDAVGRVFEHEDATSVGQRAERLHVGELPVEVNRQNPLRARGDGGLHVRRIEQPRLALDVDEDGRRARVEDRVRRRRKRHRRRDDLVARPDVQRLQRQQHPNRARARPDDVRRRGIRAVAHEERAELFSNDATCGPSVRNNVSRTVRHAAASSAPSWCR